MADFSHLKALAVTSATTREYTFDRIEGEPSLICSPGVDANADFLHARLELALAEIPDTGDQPRRQSGKATVESLEKQFNEQRDLDIKLIAKACVRNWGTPPVDKAGKPVEFSEKNAFEFLSALPDYMVDPFRNWVANVLNFAPKQKKLDGDALGNS